MHSASSMEAAGGGSFLPMMPVKNDRLGQYLSRNTDFLDIKTYIGNPSGRPFARSSHMVTHGGGQAALWT